MDGYLHTPRNSLKKGNWNQFVAKSKELPKNIQELILKIIYGGTQVWCMQHRTLMIDTIELTKYRQWLLIIVCVFIPLLIKKVFAIVSP